MLDSSKKEEFISRVTQACEKIGIESQQDKVVNLIAYLELLIKWNKAYNLTAIRDPDEMLVKHIIDSLSIVPYVIGDQLADIGTGAGLPGIPLAIMFPDKQFTLVDSNGKKTRFLTQVKMNLSLSNVQVIHGRVEQVPDNKVFDQISSRAFTALDNMVNLCKHLLSSNGEFLAMKGLEPHEEIKNLPEDFVVDKVEELCVPECEDQRHLIIIKKSS